MRISVARRADIPRVLEYAIPLASVALTGALAALLFALLGFDIGKSFGAFFILPLSSESGIEDLLLKAAPLIIIAVGLAEGLRAGVSNIGAEGQVIMGAITGGWVALHFIDASGLWILPLMCLAAVLGGAGWSAIPAFLRTRLGVSEILTSLMLTYVAALFLGMLVYGPWRDPEGMNFPQSQMLNDSETLPLLVAGTRLHIGVVVAPVVAVVAWVVTSRSFFGFKLRVVGAAPAAARYAGFPAKQMEWATMLISGALAGLAGIFEVAGPIGQLIPELTPGYGFTAIIVAFLGRLNPIGIIPAGLIVALSYIGGESAQVATGLPKGVTGIVQGMLLLLLLGSDFFLRHRVTLVTGRKAAA